MSLSLVSRLVLQSLWSQDKPLFGRELMQETGLPSGTIYPILKRFENAGIVFSVLEDIDPKEEGRPARRYYQLTKEGKKKASESSDEMLRLFSRKAK